MGWFLQVDAQFGIRNMSKVDTHSWHMMALLDTETASCAGLTLKSTPVGKKYEALKSFLLSVFLLSKWQQAQWILATQDLGDRHPSQVADFLLRTLSDEDPAILMQFLLMTCLPPQVQSARAS